MTAHREAGEQAGADHHCGGGERLGDRLRGEALLGVDDGVLEARIGDRGQVDRRPELVEP